MAEFSEVMRQFDRMCKAHAGCVDCPLSIKGCVETKCSIGSFIDESEYIEREIIQWAAENPELVYETWFDYLLRIGVIPENAPAGGVYHWIVESIKNKHIPADIAEKLGLQLKEE